MFHLHPRDGRAAREVHALRAASNGMRELHVATERAHLKGEGVAVGDAKPGRQRGQREPQHQRGLELVRHTATARRSHRGGSHLQRHGARLLLRTFRRSLAGDELADVLTRLSERCRVEE